MGEVAIANNKIKHV